MSVKSHRYRQYRTVQYGGTNIFKGCIGSALCKSFICKYFYIFIFLKVVVALLFVSFV